MLICGAPSLHKSMIEHINAEVCLRTIVNIRVAIDWLKSTFLFVRMKRNPAFYGLSASSAEGVLENKLQELCMDDLRLLDKHHAIQLDASGNCIPSPVGKWKEPQSKQCQS